MILSCLGGIAGVALAVVFLRAFLAIVPGDLPRIQGLRIDGVTLLFSLAVSLITGVAFGLFPAWSASRSDTALALGSNRSSPRGRHEARIHSALVIAEIAISLVLLAGSGLRIEVLWKPFAFIRVLILMACSLFASACRIRIIRPKKHYRFSIK